MNQREFTPAEFAQAAADARDNWDWNAEAENSSPDIAKAMQEYLDFGDDATNYARTQFADDDGIIRIDRAFSDVWDMLDEYSRSWAGLK